MFRPLLTLLAMFLAVAAEAQDCRDTEFDSNRYTLCEVDTGHADLRLFLKDVNGEVLGQFSNINATLESEGRQLTFAMNAGMYHSDRAPVGHYVENSVEVMRVVPNKGPGNFGLLPKDRKSVV